MLDLTTEKIWIALTIGNSRYHWAWFLNTHLQASWDSDYPLADEIDRDTFLNLLPLNFSATIVKYRREIDRIPIYLASVVPTQTIIWQRFPQVKCITLADIPLLNLYPTLGIDRALALLGAGENYGYPVLVIDGGTALTITGVNRARALHGGAIMPGLKLQFRSLFFGTAALPEILLPSQLPSRWGENTDSAIASGVLHAICAGVRAFIDDWLRLFPDSNLIFTGGDGKMLASYLSSMLPVDLVDRITVDRQLIFAGIAKIIH